MTPKPATPFEDQASKILNIDAFREKIIFSQRDFI